MTTDVQRIERAFPAYAMVHVLHYGATMSTTTARATLLCRTAVDEALAGVSPRELPKLMRRLSRAWAAFSGPYTGEGTRVDRVGLLAFRLLQELLEREILILHQGTPMSDAMDLIMPALGPAVEDDEVSAFVERELAPATRRLQGQGVYGRLAIGAALAA